MRAAVDPDMRLMTSQHYRYDLDNSGTINSMEEVFPTHVSVLSPEACIMAQAEMLTMNTVARLKLKVAHLSVACTDYSICISGGIGLAKL